jgi:hypothetical protein
MRRVLTLAFAVVALTTAAQAQVKIAHDPAYVAGAVLRTKAEVTTNQTLIIAGMNVDTRSESFFTSKETIGERTAEGKLPIASEFESFIINLATPAGNLEFDSANPDKATSGDALQPYTELFRRIAKAKWTTLVGKDHKVESVTYEGDPFAGLDEAVKSETDPNRYKQQANTELARLPDGPVSPGDSWKRTEESDIGGGQQFVFEKEYTYVGSEESGGKTFDKISSKVLKCRYQMTPPVGSPLAIDPADLGVKESTGTLLYDRAARTVTSSTEKVRLAGDLKMKINGMDFPGSVDLTIAAKVTIE